MASLRLTARHPEVYEPCADSFALEDALLARKACIASVEPKIVIEIGCGSGYVLAAMCSILKSQNLLKSAQILATDISPAAAQTAKSTLSQHGFSADVINTDLLHGLEDRLQGRGDVIICNPPYVVTSDDEVRSGGLSSAWAGGVDGRRVIDRMLPVVARVLSAKGLFFLVLVSENKPHEVSEKMSAWGFCSEKVLTKKTEEETLTILRFWRPAREASGPG